VYRHGKSIPHHYIFPSLPKNSTHLIAGHALRRSCHRLRRNTCHARPRGSPYAHGFRKSTPIRTKVDLGHRPPFADLQSVFSRLDLFDRAVLENGALLYTPETKQERLLCEPPPLDLQEALRTRSVPFSTGRGILATWEPNKTAVLEAIHDLGLDLQVIFNKAPSWYCPPESTKPAGLKPG
jgi:hypothetical protein